MAFSPDGKALVCAHGMLKELAQRVYVKVWDTATWQVRPGPEFRAPYAQLALGPGGKVVAVLDLEKQNCVRLFDTATGRPGATLPGDVHVHDSRSMTFSADGTVLALSVEHGRLVKLFDVATGKERASWRVSAGRPAAVAFSPDGKRVAIQSRASIVQVWDVATSRPLAYLAVRFAPTCLRFAPDNRTLAVGGNRDLELWDVTTRGPVARLKGHTGTLEALAFTADGRTLASGGAGGVVLLWDVTPGK
jgi:WD40 repeat protein